jgi:hypothetical protein
MVRVADDTLSLHLEVALSTARRNLARRNPRLSLHLEVALSTAAPHVLEGLAASDRRRRDAAVGEIVEQLVERLRCFDIRAEPNGPRISGQPMLFPSDMEPLG